MDRKRRRKLLESQETQEDGHCVRGYKDSPLIINEDEDFLTAIQQHLTKIIVPQYHHTITDIEIQNKEELKAPPKAHTISCETLVTTSADERTWTENLIVPIHWKRQTHTTPQTKATLQVRAPEKIITEILNMLVERKICITREVSTKHGLDIDVDDPHRGVSTLYLARKHFGGTVKTTRTLSGTEKTTGDKKYTITALYRTSDE